MGDKSRFYKKRWKARKTSKTRNSEPYRNETSHSPDKLDIGRNVDIPYYGWRLFFPDKEYKADGSIAKQIKAIKAFAERHETLSSLFTMTNLEAGMSFDIDIRELYNDSEFMKQWPNFQDDIYENPLKTLNCMKLGIHQKILETVPEENLKYVLNFISSLPMIKLGILNHQPMICLRDLKLNYYGKLISTRGCVIRVGRVKYVAQWIVFACSKCHLQKLIKQLQEVYTSPKKCDVCGVSKFYPVLDSPCVKSTTFQIIRIQEPLNDEQENKGRVPKILDVELMDDLVNICMPGDDITLTGVIKAPLKRCKSFEFRASIMHRCECIKRNGLQDRCMMWDCMGRPECMTKLYPVCGPGRAALLKLTDLGDKEVALKKFYCADQAREAALAAYCRLVCNDPRRGPCDRNDNLARYGESDDNENKEKSWCKPIYCDDSTSRPVYIPSPADATCCIPEICYTCCLPPKLEKYSAPPCPPPSCVPLCPLPTYLPCVQCCQ